MTSLLEKYQMKTDENLPEESSDKTLSIQTNDQSSVLGKYQKKPDIEQDRIYQKYMKVPDVSREEYNNMTLTEKIRYAENLDREQRYLHSKGFTKGLLSGATIGATERIEELQPKEHERGFTEGQLIGTFLPFGAISKVVSLPLKLIPAGYKAISAVGRIAASTLTGATHETAREAIAGEELDPYSIAVSGAAFGGLHALVEGIPAAKNWFKSLNTKQQSEMLAEGIIPKNLSKDQWKFYSEEVQPALSKIAEQEYETALKTASEEATAQYQQKLANAKAEHEKELFELARQNKMTDADALKAQQQYDNKLKQVAAEHEMEMASIQKQNQEALQEYQQKQQEFEQTKTRENAVQAAINRPIPEATESLQGRVSPMGEDLTLRPQALPEESFSAPSKTLKNKVGQIFSREPITNKTEAAFKNMEAVRASDQADYGHVNKLYDKSEQLNQQVQAIHPDLVNDLENIIREIDAIPEPSAPQKQIRTAAINTRQRLVAVDPDGNVTGYKPVSNQMLLEQAKALRYALDFDFAHGNPKNIFKPMINSLQDAAEQAAINSGNEAAYQANREARTAWREWNDLYGNDYIKKYRNRGNHEFIKTFDSSLNPDDFNLLNKVLGKSNSGQELAAQTRRELINGKLDKFYKNPRLATVEEFNDVLRELSPVLNPGEENAIRQQFSQARQSPEFIARKPETLESPKEPKLKEIPEKVRIPLKKETPKPKKEITAVKIPLKAELKASKEMQAAARKMKRTNEELMTMANNRTGLREMRSDLSKTEAGKKLFEKIGQEKVRDLLQGGKVEGRFKGEELYNIINKGDNFSMLSEILGEEVAEDLLNASRTIADKKVTADTLKKGLKKIGSLKALYLFGIL